MRVILFSSRQYDDDSFTAANRQFGYRLHFQPSHLDAETAILAHGYDVVCPFVNDTVDAAVLERLADGGTRLIALRSAGFNHVDLAAAERLGITVVRVPAYSPHAVAEHAVALILALNRRLPRAVARTREGDFSLNGLLGFDLHGKTVGVIGTGIIGSVFAKIMMGFGMHVLAHSVPPYDDELIAFGARYVELDELLHHADIVSLHCPLLPSTHHLINARTLARMKHGAMLINTGRGGLVDAQALVDALKSGQLGHLGLDVYEEESGLFFEDHSDLPLQDDVLARLLTFPNVIVTSHQAFFTREALAEIAHTTLLNIEAWHARAPQNVVVANR
ncbi:2-hydroxyacid dehydrogenase [Burkholderia sp. AU42008]|uniref:2-hydroxyacid dehydrogenase n=1 Tax=unclassified Burkholderia TaxID=2613784 RepID=UPI000B79E613|nr:MULTISPECIES: 2-hydroxyacid dehydrogenase [unclassified Burkholderia]MBR8234061.1 2-hydroxyacid dehydrogenase [Burkholderia sp. AU32357]MBY4872442.1 2-hydroxyacid dehydrogenase [Burkholderia sp. AU42008]OXI44232.1 hydroxyacid dehydrogenase [Burkholderia sp. AU17457]